MSNQKDPEAADTDQTTESEAVASAAICSPYPASLREERKEIEARESIPRNQSCPLERMVRTALVESGIRFVGESKKTKNLDFLLPDFGVYIEIKGGFSERSTKQLHRDPNVILVQGVKSAKFITKLLKSLSNKEVSHE